jgi:hypothetical protein
MNRKILQQRTWFNLLGALILVGGLGSAALIYHRAADIPYGALGYEIADGTIYPIMPENSKAYRHNLEVYGGKFGVMMDDFNRWFLGLWQGKSLALILAGMSILVSFAFFYKAKCPSPTLKSPGTQENNPEDAG